MVSNESGTVMPVQPMYGGAGGFGDGNWSWLIVLFLFAMMGGWGNGMGNNGGNGMFPWLMTGQAGINANTNQGFDTAALGAQLSGIQSSINTGFGNAEVAGCQRAMDAMQTAYQNQIASMNQNFASQQALDARLDSMAMAQQKCCCDNQLQTESLRATVLSENCEDRNQAMLNTRDIISNQTAGFQRILDKMNEQELYAERRENQNLRERLNMATLAASQNMQTAQLIADNTAQTQYIVNRVAPYPIPSYTVPNPFGTTTTTGT